MRGSQGVREGIQKREFRSQGAAEGVHARLDRVERERGADRKGIDDPARLRGGRGGGRPMRCSTVSVGIVVTISIVSANSGPTIDQHVEGLEEECPALLGLELEVAD